jgi:putative transposase
VPNGKVAEVARMLKAIHAQENRKAAAAKAKKVVARLRAMKLKTAADLVEQKAAETPTHYGTRVGSGDRSAPRMKLTTPTRRSARG